MFTLKRGGVVDTKKAVGLFVTVMFLITTGMVFSMNKKNTKKKQFHFFLRLRKLFANKNLNKNDKKYKRLSWQADTSIPCSITFSKNKRSSWSGKPPFSNLNLKLLKKSKESDNSDDSDNECLEPRPSESDISEGSDITNQENVEVEVL